MNDRQFKTLNINAFSKLRFSLSITKSEGTLLYERVQDLSLAYQRVCKSKTDTS